MTINSKLKRTVSFRLTRSSSSRESTDMQFDVPSPTAEASSGSSSAEKNILLEEKHLKFQNKAEKDAFKQLKTQRFILTPAYDQPFCAPQVWTLNLKSYLEPLDGKMFGKLMRQGLNS